ncbi:CheY-like chemotaxis protein [Catalinimonas alkaloidigena]|uniref:response regulator n=1 Tax=Catalinimonas alkaloidigena TaxID=1075417 RepID=UPI00240496F0|nr:response regulator [Catalinimonas alkaloidigena]MDF9798463.1 CheY-like chemotaxis protein [Catalinimonas alkaloidigena]
MKKIKLACIIDDDTIYVYGVKKLMKIVDFCENTLVFKNGKEAIKYLKPVIEQGEGIPDVILLDINMPVMDGWQFLDEFVKIKPKTKEITIYMVSSSVDPEDVNKVKDYADVSDYIIKPITEEALISLIDKNP